MDGDEEKKDPTHHADLDPKNMKVASRLYINFCQSMLAEPIIALFWLLSYMFL